VRERSKRRHFLNLAPSIAVLVVAIGCSDRVTNEGLARLGVPTDGSNTSQSKPTLSEVRRKFTTNIVESGPAEGPAPVPPPSVFSLVKYPSPVGDLAAYVTPDPGDATRRPAIIWITGGDSNTIGEVWEPAPFDNDQTAAAYRNAGLVMMFPSLRGGNDNPGKREGFYGEVDDVLAAADYLAKLPYVNPSGIYLGGHSTGGTLAMLVGEISPRFRAIFAFGPISDVRNYGGQFVYHKSGKVEEAIVRSPLYWLDSVQTPLFVIEGSDGNVRDLNKMKGSCTNPKVQFFKLAGLDHFAVLAGANQAIAAAILHDNGPSVSLSFTPQELGSMSPASE